MDLVGCDLVLVHVNSYFSGNKVCTSRSYKNQKLLPGSSFAITYKAQLKTEVHLCY